MAVPAKGNWQEGDYPDINTQGFAQFFAPNDVAEIVIGGRPTVKGTTLQPWISAMTKSRTVVYPDTLCRPPKVRAYRVDGEPAQLRVLACPTDGANAGGALVLTVHRDHGYGLGCFSGETGTSPEFVQRCLDWLSTFRFST